MHKEKGLIIVPQELVKPFVITAPPIPGESLIGFIARTLSDTAVNKMAAGLSLAGIATRKPQHLASTLREGAQIDGLATLLGVAREEILQRLQPATIIPGTKAKARNFFGMPLRQVYRNLDERRISPRGLQKAPYHRAIWQLAPLSFDPESLETLVSSCPVCEKPLGWRRCRGICFCDSCVDPDGRPNVDLRDYPQSLAEIEDEVAIRFVTDLVHFDHHVRKSAMGTLYAPWSALDPSEVFETIIALATVLHDRKSSHGAGVARAGKKSSLAGLSATHLGQAGRAILCGKKGLDELVERVRDRDDGSDIAQSQFNFRGLRSLGRDKAIHPHARLELREATKRHLRRYPIKKQVKGHETAPHGYVPVREAAKVLSLDHRALIRLAERSSITNLHVRGRGQATFIDLERIRSALPEIDDIASGLAAAKLIGVRPKDLQRLADRSMICRPRQTVINPSTGRAFEWYLKSSIDKLLGKLRNLPNSGDQKMVSVAEALADPKCSRFAPVHALIAIAEGRVIARTKSGAVGSWPEFTMVDNLNDFIASMTQILPELATPGPSQITIYEAAEIIGTSYPRVVDFAAAGFLTRQKTRSHVYSALECVRFRETYVMYAEAKARLGAKSSLGLAKALRNLGILPVRRVGQRGISIYDRKAFEIKLADAQQF